MQGRWWWTWPSERITKSGSTGYSAVERKMAKIAALGEEAGFSSILAETRERGFSSFNLNTVSIVAFLISLRQRGHLITKTVLTVKDQIQLTAKITLSSNYGRNNFPYHTDYSFLPTPPKFVILANLSHNSFDRSTSISSLSALPPDLMVPMRRAQWLLRSRNGSFLISSAQPIGTEVLFRWDLDFLVPHNQSALDGMKCVPLHLEQTRKEILWTPRSAVMIDNWSCAHARGGMASLGDDMLRRLDRYEVWCHA
jgi:hypothetical protein